MVELFIEGDKSPPTGNSSQRQIEDYGVRLLAESAKSASSRLVDKNSEPVSFS
jgi:hypothetical protein